MFIKNWNQRLSYIYMYFKSELLHDKMIYMEHLKLFVTSAIFIFMQVCCGPGFLIYQSTVKWPGTTNDARIFNNSGLCTIMERGITIHGT